MFCKIQNPVKVDDFPCFPPVFHVPSRRILQPCPSDTLLAILFGPQGLCLLAAVDVIHLFDAELVLDDFNLIDVPVFDASPFVSFQASGVRNRQMGTPRPRTPRYPPKLV